MHGSAPNGKLLRVMYQTPVVLQGGFESGFEGSAGGGGQTKEHAQLARSLGVEQLAVVVSKLDTCHFSQQRFADIQAALLPFLKGCGFRPAAVQWLPAVGPTGQNLVKAPTEAQLSWFQVALLHLMSLEWHWTFDLSLHQRWHCQCLTWSDASLVLPVKGLRLLMDCFDGILPEAAAHSFAVHSLLPLLHCYYCLQQRQRRHLVYCISA